MCLEGGTVKQLVAVLRCSEKVLSSNLGQGSFCTEFTCSPCEWVGSLQGTLFHV